MRYAWDCATGSGQVAHVLSRHFFKVYANDISQRQLSHAPGDRNIEYHNVPSEDTGFPAGLFDLITVAQAIHWFDFDDFYAEVKRVARKKAVLAVIGYGMVQVSEEIDPLIREFADRMFGHYFSDNRAWLDQRYTTIPFPFQEIPAPDFSSELRWSRQDFEGFLNSWSPVQQYKNDHGSNPADQLMSRIKPFWPESTNFTVSFPIFIRLGRI